MTAVAAETGPDVFVQMDEPLWRVLYRYRHIEERLQRLALDERVARVDAGMMNSHGINAPDVLNDEMRNAKAAIADFERGPTDAGDTLARGLALAERMEKGRVLSDDALQAVGEP